MQTDFNTTSPTNDPEHRIPDKLINDAEMAKTIGCARSTIWKWVAEGIIPKPLKIGGMSRWKLSDANAVIAQADAERAA